MEQLLPMYWLTTAPYLTTKPYAELCTFSSLQVYDILIRASLLWNVTPKFHTSHWVLFLNWSFLWIYLIMHVFWFTKKLFEHLWKFFAFTELHVQWWPKPKKWQNKSHHCPISCAVFIGTRLRNDHLTQSATQCAASVHTLHMPKLVITFVFKVLRNALLRYILYTCPNLW